MNRRKSDPRQTFKVRLNIEEFDPETEDGRRLDGTTGGPVAQLESYDQAKRFVEAANRLLARLVEESRLTETQGIEQQSTAPSARHGLQRVSAQQLRTGSRNDHQARREESSTIHE